MSGRRWVITAAVLFVAALSGWAVFLSGRGPANADRWVTVVGFFGTTVLAAGSFAAGWSASRSPASARQAAAADRVAASGAADASGGGRANTGIEGYGDGRTAQVNRSGDATARGPGSVANTGVSRTPRT
ncbi:hypothetical protein [Actinoplanes sichuanensis]|uniref:Uncharacterized protein n=1 Tax=Actinoplanes sichuanensis TaxID=512349 RepID=A0ABW4A0C4_9ACTN|nr:hypothetical protein [Actinoplanes sichuanensis]